MRKQRPAAPAAAELRQDEQILEIKARFADKRRIVVKEQREPRRLLTEVTENHLRRRTRTEKRLAQSLLGGRDLVGEPLVFGEAPNELQDQRNVALGGALYAEHGGIMN